MWVFYYYFRRSNETHNFTPFSKHVYIKHIGFDSGFPWIFFSFWQLLKIVGLTSLVSILLLMTFSWFAISFYLFTYIIFEKKLKYFTRLRLFVSLSPNLLAFEMISNVILRLIYCDSIVNLNGGCTGFVCFFATISI